MVFLRANLFLAKLAERLFGVAQQPVKSTYIFDPAIEVIGMYRLIILVGFEGFVTILSSLFNDRLALLRKANQF